MIMCSYLRTRSHKPSNNDITRRNATRLLASSWAKSSRKCEMSLYCMVRYTWTEWESVSTLLRVWFCTTFDFSPLEWSSCCPKYNFWLKHGDASTISTTATTVNLLHEHTSAAMLLASVLGPGSWWMHWLAALLICNIEASRSGQFSLRADVGTRADTVQAITQVYFWSSFSLNGSL